MKQTSLLALVLVVYLPAAGAVDFNKDALKTMQQEGHKMLEEDAQGQRAFVSAGGQCLQAGKNGSRLVLAKCNDKSKQQQWLIDGKGRLASESGSCVGLSGDANKPGAQAVLQKCSGDKFQKWKQDGKNRLVNGKKHCLQPDGNSGKAGTAVVTAACSDAADQAWR